MLKTFKEWKTGIESNLNQLVNDNINGWGSRQYNTANGFYNMFQKIRKDLNLSDTLKVLNIKVSFSGKNSIDSIKHNIIFDRLNKIKNNQRHMTDSDYYYFDNLLTRSNIIDDIFNAQRHASYDLWTSAKIIAEYCFNELKIKNIPISPGIGPKWNVEMQNQNYETGLYCALLVEYKFIKDDSCFSGFDT